MTWLTGKFSELADEATEYCKTQPREIAGSLWEKTFAELIINECKKVIDPTYDLCSIAEEIHRYKCIIMLDKHFGLNEKGK